MKLCGSISSFAIIGLVLGLTLPAFAQQRSGQTRVRQFNYYAKEAAPSSQVELSIGDNAPPEKESKTPPEGESNRLSPPAKDRASSDLIRGKVAFNENCLSCHDAQKSLTVSKSFEEWMSTIEKMSKKEDADIPKNVFESIATYLTLIANAPSDSNETPTSSAAGDDKTKKQDQTNAADVSRGAGLFISHCTSCHDAEKSTSKTKSLSQWRATVQRMAEKQGANIPSGSIEPIAAYLASLSKGSGSADDNEATASDSADAAAASGITFNGTLSPTWRGGNDNLQNGGFFPDVWLGANWESGKQLSGRVTACVACHDVEDGQGDRFELVEAALRYDLGGLFDKCRRQDIKASIDAGRFIVPFGAFSSQSNPGVYRTVSRPLIYNMGQRVRDGDLGDPVLPMPYADEGANLNFGRNLAPGVRADWNGYVVNGLRSDRDGINFDQSRAYVANNNRPTWGTRATLTAGRLRLGGSILTGQSSPSGGFENVPDALFYKIYGYDATYQVPNLIRLQFEYARRDSDRIAPDPDVFRVTDRTSGYYIEGEVWNPYFKRLSFITRFDSQDRRSAYAPGESTIGLSSFGVQRFSYGVNFNLKTAGLVMLNHERWYLPGGLERTDVIGLRWAYSF